MRAYQGGTMHAYRPWTMRACQGGTMYAYPPRTMRAYQGGTMYAYRPWTMRACQGGTMYAYRPRTMRAYQGGTMYAYRPWTMRADRLMITIRIYNFSSTITNYPSIFYRYALGLNPSMATKFMFAGIFAGQILHRL